MLTKFVEHTYEKVDKLLEIRDAAQGRLRDVEKEIEIEKKELQAEGEEIGEENEDMWYLRRLDGGLFTLQTVDYILAWVAMEDDGVSNPRFVWMCCIDASSILTDSRTHPPNASTTRQVPQRHC